MGTVPSKVDVNRTYLPYVTVNSANRYEYVTYEKYMTLLFEDLKRAEELLGKSDVVLKMSFEDTETTSSVWPYRKKPDELLWCVRITGKGSFVVREY